MGNKHSRIIEVDDIQQKLSQCIQIQTKNCPVYGFIYFVQYQNMQFYVTESNTNSPPPLNSLHLITQTNLLIIPKFTLLQQTEIRSIEELLQLMIGVSQLCRQDQVGMGYNRIGYANKWGVVGQKTTNWAYRQILKNRESKGIYLAPQVMLELSQQKKNPKYDHSKSDMFTFGIMLLELIFKESMQNIFDYYKYEIKLKPLLQKLNFMKQNYGQTIYLMFLKMLELDHQERINFDQLIQVIQNYKKVNSKLLGSNMTSSTNSNFQQSSKRVYRNQVSPLRGITNNRGKIPQRIGKTPERSRIISNTSRSPIRQSDYQKQQYQRLNKSPLRRDLRINTKYEKQNNTFSNFANIGFNSTKATNKSNNGRMQGLNPLIKR